MNTTAHPVAPEEVMAFVDGELSANPAQAVAAHVDQCGECAGLVEHFRGTSQWMAQWEVGGVPERVQQAVEEEAARAGSVAGSAGRRTLVPGGFWRWRLWAIGGGGLAATVVALVVVHLSSGTHQTLPLKIQSRSEGRRLAEPALEQRMMGGPEAVGSLGSPSAARASSFLLASSSPVASSTGEPMIARTVSLLMTVKELDGARSALDAILARHHGYAAELRASTLEGGHFDRFNASLRIPAPELAAAVEELKTLGRVVDESQSGEEVSQQHTDLVERLKTAQETEERFRAILQQRTGSVGDVLEVEKRIAGVRGEIEGMEAQRKALEHRVDFATVDLLLAEESRAHMTSSAEAATTRVRNAFVDGLGNAGATALGMVLFVEEYGPAAVLWVGVLALPGMLLWRRYRRMYSRI